MKIEQPFLHSFSLDQNYNRLIATSNLLLDKIQNTDDADQLDFHGSAVIVTENSFRIIKSLERKICVYQFNPCHPCSENIIARH